MMFGTSLALIAQEFQGRERGTALGIWGATTALAVSTGPLVGGALVDALSWRWIFLVNVPIGVAGLVVARLRLRESRDPVASGVDMRGVALLCPALFLFVYALIRGNEEGWGSALITPGQILAGIGIGLATPALASTAVGVVRPQLSGMASGASNTARQLGLATGIAALGSIFQSKIESTLTPLLAGVPASSHVHELARAVASGGAGRALQAVPPAARDKVADAAHHAFVTGFSTIAMVSVAVAAVGSVAGYALVRSRDFVGGPAAAPAEPTPAEATREPARA